MRMWRTSGDNKCNKNNENKHNKNDTNDRKNKKNGNNKNDNKNNNENNKKNNENDATTKESCRTCRLWFAPLNMPQRGGPSKRAYSAPTPVDCCVYILTHVSISSLAVWRSRAAFCAAPGTQSQRARSCKTPRLVR